jgi:hypothetical protein
LSRALTPPPPEPGREAKQKLELLRKRLPDLVPTWARERWYGNQVEVRLGPAEAKVTLVSLAADAQGQREPGQDEVLMLAIDEAAPK